MLGMNHIVELMRQLRGDGGRSQIDGAENALTTGYDWLRRTMLACLMEVHLTVTE